MLRFFKFFDQCWHNLHYIVNNTEICDLVYGGNPFKLLGNSDIFAFYLDIFSGVC